MSKTSRTKITQRMIESLKPVTKETWIMDSEVVGLGIRQRPNASTAWCLRYKLPATGQDRKDQIGKVGSVTLDYARAIARQRLGQIAQLGDVVDRKLETRLKETVSDLIARVVEDMEAKGRSRTYINDFTNQCRAYVDPAMGSSLVRDVTQTDVDRALMKLRAKPHLHNRVRSNLSKLFNVAIRERLRMDNPVFKADKTPEEPRQRVLDDEEVTRLLAALDANPGQEADAFRLLYLTGSRPKELLQSKWQDFNLPQDPKLPSMWTKPAQTVKQRRTQTVELSPLASAVLRRMKEERTTALRVRKGRDLTPGDYVFPSRKGDDKHLSELKDHWKRIAGAAKLVDTRPYDLRKSFASRVLAAIGDPKVAMSLTGHTQVGVFLKHYTHLQKGQQGAALSRVQWVPTAPEETTAPTSE
jgi:integrase